MCGIAGFSGDYHADLLGRMAAAQSHRGPDDQGIEFLPEARIGLAHRRLSIIDLSPAGHQPMWDDDHSVAITYNGELYNFRELRKELVEDGFRFRSSSDTEVLLKLYLRDGEAMLDKLNGIFAFAIWDSRARSLFLARDQVGVKPLYYAQTPDGFLFASELKAILQSREVDRRLDLRAVDFHLHYLWSPSPTTMLEGVKKLSPGAALIVRDGRITREWQYWALPYDQPIDAGLDLERAVEALRDELAAAVRRQMVADVPVGAFLSGGLDSSAVVSFACDSVDPESLRCFTIGFEDEAALAAGVGADLGYARQVAQHLGVPLDTVWVGPEMFEELPRMLYFLDEPQTDPAPINALLICELARSHDIKVLLSGTGGDDLFTGYRRHTALLAERWWSWLPGPARSLLRHAATAIPPGNEFLRRLGKAFQYADLAGDDRLVSYLYWVSPGQLDGVYSQEARSALKGHRAAEPLLAALAGLPEGTPALNRLLYLEGKFFLPDHNLAYTDKMAMASGVEVRVPLLDRTVVDLAARLPLDLKQRGSVGKWIFRKAMEDRLPREVIYRPKAGFGAPIRHWLRGPLRGMVDETLSQESLTRRGLFDPVAVRRLVDAQRAGREDAAFAVFGFICIELWCRMFVDTDVPSLDWARS